MTDTTLKRLLEVLDEERAFLLKGDIAAVGRLEETKLELVEHLETGDRPPVSDIHKVRQIVERNHRLLEAARKGLQSGAHRLKEIRKAMLRLDTYTRSGDLTNLHETPPNVSRRA